MKFHSLPESSDPLVVDLDGTLTPGDIFFEQIATYLLWRPLGVFQFPFWLSKGKAHLKSQIARRVPLDSQNLPFRRNMIDWLKFQKSKGRLLVLATASHLTAARAATDGLNLFDAVLATTDRINLQGEEKLKAVLARLKGPAFFYLGDCAADLPLWRACKQGLAVNPDKRLEILLNQEAGAFTVFRDSPGRIRTFLKAIRAYQWSKNLLVFAPVMAAHQLMDPAIFIPTLLSFISLSLCASAVYLLNDLLDRDVDRSHPVKRERPVAAGRFPIKAALALIPFFLFAAFSIGLFLPPAFLWILAGYLGLTTLYSYFLKKIVLVDVLCLALLYTVRIFAGAAASQVPISKWFALFSIFFFFSLAMLKRTSELKKSKDSASLRKRGYRFSDLQPVFSLGLGSGFVSLLVMILYQTSPEIYKLYRHPGWLWAMMPVLLFWMGRMWLLAYRGRMDEDPLLFSLRDRTSYAVLAVLAVLLSVAS